MEKGTVLVNLRRDWFALDGSLYQVRDNPHEFPAEYAEEPKELSEKEQQELIRSGKTIPKDQKYAILPSSAEIVEAGKEVAVLQQTANGGVVEVATAVEGDVKSVGGALDKTGNEQPTQSTSAAETAAKDLNIDVGGKPRESGPLPAGSRPRR